MTLRTIIVPLLALKFVSCNEIVSTFQTHQQEPKSPVETITNYETNPRRIFEDIASLQKQGNKSYVKSNVNGDILQDVFGPNGDNLYHGCNQTNMCRRFEDQSHQNYTLNAVESLIKDLRRSKELRDNANNKVKGYVEFQNEEPHGEINDTLASWNSILASLLPQQVSEMFRLSYLAKSTKTPKFLTLGERMFNLTKDNNEMRGTTTPYFNMPLKSLPPTSNIIDNNYILLNNTEGNIQAMNNTTYDIKSAEQNTSLTHRGNSYKLKNYSISELNTIRQDNEDSNISKTDEDNSVASSKIVAKQFFHKHPDIIETQAEVTNVGGGTTSSIQDSHQSFHRAHILHPTKQLDFYQEEVEKQFNPKALRTNTEAPSRTFLKNFEKHSINSNPTRHKNQFFTDNKSIKPESLLHTYIYSSEADTKKFVSSCSVQELGSIPCSMKNGNQSEISSAMSADPVYRDRTSKYKPSDSPEQESKVPVKYGAGKNTQVSYNFEIAGVNSQFNDRVVPEHISKKFVIHVTTPASTNNQNHLFTHVDIHKSLNVYNKFTTEKNGSLIEQHEIFTEPEIDHNRSNPVSLSKHPIHVMPAEEYQQKDLISGSSDDANQQYKNQHVRVVESPIPYPIKIEKLVPQPYAVKQLIEKYIDRPVHVDRIVEKHVKVPVTEFVERIVHRTIPVEKIIDRPVPIPYPVHVDRFIDRPYAVQVPVAIAIPVPVHQYIDRPFPVEKLVEKPIHVPYPVEKVVEKIVEKHVPVEVERVAKNSKGNFVQKLDGRPFLKKIAQQSSVKPEAHSVLESSDLNKNGLIHETDVPFELVPPPFPVINGWQKYQTLPGDANILFFGYNEPPANIDQEFHVAQPVKRGIRGKNIKRSPENGRNLRLEYGFKPPLVPSLEIDRHGYPLSVRRSIRTDD